MAATRFAPLLAVPSRNRAGLALATLRSILAEPDPRLRVWVSDNSTDTREIEALRLGVEALRDPRARYIRPPSPLPMAKHYDWVIQSAADEREFSHVSCPSDRLIFVPGALRRIMQIAENHPERLLVFAQDHVNDLGAPVILNQNDWTGRVLEVKSADFLDFQRGTGFNPDLPRVINCLTPTDLIRRVRSHYGNVMDSISPDFCFGYRTLEREDHYLHYDCRAMIDYALPRSNGHSHSRGKLTQDYQDFLANLDARGINYAAPIPQFPGVTNTHMSEYNLVREFSKSSKFRPINLAIYLDLLARDVREVEDAEMRGTLTEWLGKGRTKLAREQRLAHDVWRARLGKVAHGISPAYLRRKTAKSLSRKWPAYDRGAWPVLRSVGLTPYAFREHLSRWPDADAALAHACEHPLAPVDAKSPLEYRIPARLLEVVR